MVAAQDIVARIVGAKQSVESVFKIKAAVVTLNPFDYDEVMQAAGLHKWKTLDHRPKLCGLEVELDTGFPRDQVMVWM